VGTREGIKITEKGNLVVGKIVMGQDPIKLTKIHFIINYI